MLDDFLSAFSAWFGDQQQALFEAIVQPLMYSLGMGNLLEDAYTATGWLMVGVIQLLLMLVCIGALQRWWPAEQGFRWRVMAPDVFYTLLHRLGVFRVGMFFMVEPLVDQLFGWGAVQGVQGFQLDALVAPLWQGVTDTAWFSLLVYLMVFDFVDYWIHRGQHASNRWWALHAVHHSQREMTMWSDNRNHLLDDLLRDLIFAFTARAVGVAPGQFVAVVAITLTLESLSHANTRLRFGGLLDKLLVDPRFHRVHHAIGVGHESHGKGSLGGCNYAVLFPVWDILFGTANYSSPIEPTGIRDQLPHEGGREYGQTVWAQQWLGLKRLVGRA
jgi:sterol desaturase/sphingolipid hydroxylase (fatty acid hydroxylase superfamily)